VLIAACLVVAGAVSAIIPGEFFTLRPTHSVEKIRWEHDYRVAGDVLVLMNSRMSGPGARVDLLPGAQLKDGVWHRRENRKIDRLPLTRSPGAGDYTWCNHSGCRTLAHWLGPPPDVQSVEVRAGTACKR
jgi:hypothetical protein